MCMSVVASVWRAGASMGSSDEGVWRSGQVFECLDKCMQVRANVGRSGEVYVAW